MDGPPVAGGDNLALNGTVSGYSSQENEINNANEVIDGISDDISERWSASGMPQWVEIDLGQDYPLAEIRMHTYLGRAYQYTVEARSGSGTYSTVVDRSSNTTVGNPITDSLADTTARYIKVTVTGADNYAGDWVSIQEIEIIAAVQDAYADWSEGITWGSIPTSEQDFDDDPDTDSLVNLIEMAFGTDPTSANTNTYPQGEYVDNGDGARTTTLTYPKASAELTYTLKVSSNLSTWSPNGFSDETYNSETGIYSRTYTAPDTTESLFFKLEVSL